MDDLEFRRRVYAEPHSLDEEIRLAAKEDANKQQFLNDLKALDKNIESAMKVPVPDNMAERLILRQSIESHRKQKTTTRWQLAIAASVAFVIGLSLDQLLGQSYPEMGSHALAHVRHELDRTHVLETDIGVGGVNALLANYGGEVTKDLGQVYYVKECIYDHTESLHFVMQGEAGKVSVFIVPNKETLGFSDTFQDERFSGQTITMEKAHVLIVGERSEPLDRMKSRIKNNLRWSI